MTTSRIPPTEYYASDENSNRRIIRRQNYADDRHIITTKTKNGDYNVVEKDYGDHKVIYHVPIEYGDDYDISKLEDIPYVEEQLQQSTNSPKLVRRRIYQEYNDVDYDDDYEYVEEVPVVSPRRRVYLSPRRHGDKQVIKRVYETQPPTEIVEYIYEDDPNDVYDHRHQNEEPVEYVIRERVPKQIYMEEPRTSRRTIYVEDPSVPHPSSRQAPLSSPPPPPPAPIPIPPPPSQSPRRSPYQSTPRPMVNQKSGSSVRNSTVSPPMSTRKQQTTSRSPPIYEPLVRPNIPKTTEPPLRLMDVVAQNRARRGARLPKPRREVDEEQIYDEPTYSRNIIKNGFIVHK